MARWRFYMDTAEHSNEYVFKKYNNVFNILLLSFTLFYYQFRSYHFLYEKCTYKITFWFEGQKMTPLSRTCFEILFPTILHFLYHFVPSALIYIIKIILKVNLGILYDLINSYMFLTVGSGNGPIWPFIFEICAWSSRS